MRVAVFRAADDAARTAKRLAALGHEALVAPVIEIVPTGQRLPQDGPDVVIFTSAHGVEAIAADTALQRLQPLPAYCVGSRTEGCATDLGFKDVRGARADAEKLATLVASEVDRSARLLLIAGRERKPTLERTLARLGYTLSVTEVYEARPAPPWPPSLRLQFAAPRIQAALHYSRRSAELAIDQGKALDSRADLLRLRHCCLSEEAAIPLREGGADQISVSDHPDEDSLFALL